MRSTLIFILFVQTIGFSQEVLVYGKEINLNTADSLAHFHYTSDFPGDELRNYDVILIFSTGNSSLDKQDEAGLQEFVNEGGGLYLGADNLPFVEECNQLTQLFYNTQFYGNFNQDTIATSSLNSLCIKNDEYLKSGETTVSFPMDYRLRVEAWSNDNPIILSGQYGKGKIILDGGYSRFYKLNESKKVLQGILKFLDDN